MPYIVVVGVEDVPVPKESKDEEGLSGVKREDEVGRAGVRGTLVTEMSDCARQRVTRTPRKRVCKAILVAIEYISIAE